MKTKKFTKYVCISLVFTIVLSMCFGISSFADTAYANYYIASNGNIFPTPAAYEVSSVLDFPSVETGKLSNPQDLFIGDDGKIYIADSGNNRIVVLKKNDKNEYVFDFEITGSESDGSKLLEPRCVFVDEDGEILVADYGNKRLISFNKYGNFKYLYPTPTSDLLQEGFNYHPYKVAKDSKGYIYVCSVGDSNGILMLSSDGEFRNYYGTNDVTLTLWESIARLLWSREDRLGTVVTLPYTFNNIFVSDDGYVYATTTGSANSQLRKINAAGKDVLYAGHDFSDKGVTLGAGLQTFIDVSVDKDNNMFIIDSVYGRIYEYDADGRLLFAFGSNGVGKGQFSLPSSIAVADDGDLLVLDSQKGTINVFAPTNFADLVHQANRNYFAGIYTQSENPDNPSDNSFDLWNQVLKEDSFYRLALQSMGKVLWREGDYDGAIEYYYDAEDAALASEAYEELRAEFLKENLSKIASVLLVIIIAIFVFSAVKKIYRKKHPVNPNSKNPIAVTGSFVKRISRVSIHPIDGFEDIRYEGKGFYSDAFIIMAVYLVTTCLSKLCTSFIYRGGVSTEFIEWGSVILWCILPWVVVSVVNYGITTIMYGEGRFRDVIIGGAYCHLPLIFISLPLAIISNALTLNEQSLYSLAGLLSYAWVVILVFFCIKGVHGFNPLKALLVFVLTALGVVAVVFLYLIVYGLAQQFIEFIIQFVKELSYLV
ncbi:MAG: YIP1 family protein [Clostridia bacterium]|nr:YIP1 family protein [Clostridia bacterium]